MKKRRLALFMALVLLCTSLNGITLGVSAEEVEPVMDDAVELLLDEETAVLDVSEAELSADEIVLPADPVQETVILEEGALVVEDVEELNVSDGGSSADDVTDDDSILLDNVTIVEDIVKELPLYEAQEAARTAGGGYVGSTDYMEPPVVPFESGITLVGTDTSSSWNYVKFTVPEDAGGEYAFTISAADALAAAYFTVYDRNTNIIFTRQNSEAVSEGAFFRGGETYIIRYIPSFNNKLNEITWNFARTKTWEEIKNDAEQMSVNQTVNVSFETDNRGKFYKFVVPLGWQSGTYAELYGNWDSYQLSFFDADLRHLDSNPLELTADSTVYVYIYVVGSDCGFKLKNRIQELIAGARDLTLGTPASLNITENTSIMFKYVADETCEYFLETSEEYYVRLYGVYDAYGQVLDWADGIQFKKGNTYYLEIDCYNVDPNIDHYVLLTRGKIWIDILASASALPEKAEDGCYYVESGIEDYEWYIFTPDRDGFYFIEGNSLRQKVIHQEDGEMVEDEKDPNLYPSPYQLKKGETYCIGLCEAFTGDSNTVSLNIDYKAEITGITVTQERERYAEGLEDIFSLIEFTVTYSDGDSAALNNWNTTYEYNTETGEYAVCMDTMDPVYEWYITAKLMQNDMIYDLDKDIVAGDYILELYWNGLKMEETPVKVTSPEESDLPSLSIGKTLVQSTKYDEAPKLYKFTAAERGTYQISNFYEICIYKKTENGYVTDGNYGSSFFEMEAGETCCFAFIGSMWDNLKEEDTYSFQVTLQKIPKLAGISVKKQQHFKKSYLENEEDVYFDTRLKLTFDDETTDSIWIYSEDRSVTDGRGNRIEAVWTKDGEEYTGSRFELTAGKYEIRYRCGDIVLEKPVSFTVYSLEELAAEAELGIQTEVPCTDELSVVKFSPTVTGRYVLRTDVNTYDLQVFDEDMNLHTSYNTNYQCSVYLYADEVYYFYTKAEKRSFVNILIEEQPLISEAAVMPLSGTHYAGSVALGNLLNVKLTYTDGTSAVVGNYSTDDYGNVVECYIKDADGGRDYASMYTTEVNAGVYTIYPALMMLDPDSYSDSVTIKPADLELVLPDTDVLPAMTLDAYERIPGGLSEKWYTFTAPADGEYTYIGEDATSILRVSLYNIGETRLTECIDIVSLKAGETCLFSIYTTEAVKVKMVNANADMNEDVPGAELPQILELDQLYRVDLKNGEPVSVIFTPSEDGFYIIESSNISKNDPYVTLYLAADGEVLDQNDDGGSDYNFNLKSFLKAGVTYQYQISKYNDDPGSFSVILQKSKETIKTVKHVEFIVDEESITELNPAPIESLALKVRYSDDSTAIISASKDMDDYYNRFYLEEEKVSETKTQVNYKVTVSYYHTLLETADDAKIVQIDITAKKSSALPVLALDQKVTLCNMIGLNHVNREYLFTPQESGEYILNIKGSPGSEIYAEVYELDGIALRENWATGGDILQKGYSLHEGTTYSICVFAYTEDSANEYHTEYVLTKGNAVKSLEIISKPNQQTVAPGTYVVSMSGLEIKATYQNGKEETIAYGSADSYGRMMYTEYEWRNEETFLVRVWFGNIIKQFTIPAGTKDLSNVTVLKENVRANFNGFALFTPERSAAYEVFLQNTEAASKDAHDFNIYDMDGTHIAPPLRDEKVMHVYWLEKGQTYLFTYGDPDITVSILIAEEVNCKWETVSRTEPTCTTDGEHKEYCTWHEDYRVTPIPAAGHTKTELIPGKAATCTASGLTEGVICSICQTVTKAQTTIPAKGHTWDTWKETKATVFAEGSKTHTCSVCKTVETIKTADKLKPTMELTAKKITLQTGQSTKKFKVTGLAAGDSIVSMKLAKNKSVKISSVNLEKGTCKLTALDKTGKAKLKITLASGLKKTVKITVQKGAVEASSIKVESKDITLLKKQKLTLKPNVQPFTCTDKLTYKTSDKKIVTVSKKGVLKGVKAGKAKITIQAGKKKVTVNVTVKKK